MTAMRVLIVDDEPLARQRLRHLLAEIPGTEVVGECGDGTDAARAIGDLAPDVVLLDVQLPDLDGFAVAEALDGEPGAPIVVLVSSRALLDYGHRVDDSTARGFIAKADLSSETLQHVIDGPGRPVPCSG